MTRSSPFLSLLGLLIVPVVSAQGVDFETKVVFDHAAYDSAFVDAHVNYDGDLLIYFWQPASMNHLDVLARALNDDTLATYMNEYFARLAIDTSKPEGRAVLAMFRRDSPDWDFIVLQRTGDLHYIGLHGWGNIRNNEDRGRWMEQLRSFKRKDHPLDRMGRRGSPDGR